MSFIFYQAKSQVGTKIQIIGVILHVRGLCPLLVFFRSTQVKKIQILWVLKNSILDMENLNKGGYCPYTRGDIPPIRGIYALVVFFRNTLIKYIVIFLSCLSPKNLF